MDWDFYSTSAVQQEFKLDGFIDAMGDYQPTEFYKACTSEKECVYFIDEMDASIPEVLTKLNMAIANFYHEFPTERVEFDPEKVHFVAAGNTVGIGADDLYTGRAVLDAATLNRFVTVHCDYERDVEEKLAKGDTDLVDFIEGLREAAERTGVRTVFSYRQIQQAARMSGILNKKQIIETCIVGTLDDDTIRTLYTFKGGAWQEAFEAIKAA
jgi:MoxR-like ATPase